MNMYFKLRRLVVIGGVGLFWLMLLTILIVSLNAIGDVSGGVQLLYSFLFMLIGVVVTVFIAFLYSLPNIHREFDVLSNQLADETLDKKDIIERSLHTICTILVESYNNFYINIRHAIIRSTLSTYIGSSNKALALFTADELEDLEKQAKDSGKIVHCCSKHENRNRCHVYAAPIYFGKKYIGVLILVTEGYLFKFVFSIINELIEKCIDDKIALATNLAKSALFVACLKKLDKISDKVSLGQISVQEYLDQTLASLCKRFQAKAGVFVTEGHGSVWPANENIELPTEEFEKEAFANSAIICDHSLKYSFTLVVPIGINSKAGLIKLYDTSQERFEQYLDLINMIESYKLDNDLNLILGRGTQMAA